MKTFADESRMVINHTIDSMHTLLTATVSTAKGLFNTYICITTTKPTSDYMWIRTCHFFVSSANVFLIVSSANAFFIGESSKLLHIEIGRVLI